ncbi:MAG TPA: hypothetical protein PLB36_07425 [Bacillota bacterium]|nr:hypothetical protein [Bacillota bacterium]HOL12686.1 hypothetical protein [Bacillota bacterium]HPP61579.1 hypothetical protein [Bacillota bacterium]HPZ78642.1 hypothetical protein [Bacillota bacterium]
MPVIAWVLEAIGAILCLAISFLYSSKRIQAQTYVFSMSLAILLVVIGMLLSS